MSAPTLAETVAVSLRKNILEGKYLSGERLIELTLARMLSVSQITVRDALRILEQDGWVVKIPRRGVYVRSFTPEAAEEIYALVQAVESLVFKWVIEKFTRQMSADLQVFLDAARKHAHRDEGVEAAEAMFEFHNYISGIPHMPMTNQILEQLRNQVRMLEAIRQVRAPVNIRELHAQIDRHEALLHALETGNLDAAINQLNTLLDSYIQLTLSALRI